MSSIGVMFAPHHRRRPTSSSASAAPAARSACSAGRPRACSARCSARWARSPRRRPPARSPRRCGAARRTCAGSSATASSRARWSAQVLEVTAFEHPLDYGEFFKARYGPTIGVRANAAATGRAEEFDEALDAFCHEWNLGTAGRRALRDGVPAGRRDPRLGSSAAPGRRRPRAARRRRACPARPRRGDRPSWARSPAPGRSPSSWRRARSGRAPRSRAASARPARSATRRAARAGSAARRPRAAAGAGARRRARRRTRRTRRSASSRASSSPASRERLGALVREADALPARRRAAPVARDRARVGRRVVGRGATGSPPRHSHNASSARAQASPRAAASSYAGARVRPPLEVALEPRVLRPRRGRGRQPLQLAASPPRAPTPPRASRRPRRRRGAPAGARARSAPGTG